MLLCHLASNLSRFAFIELDLLKSLVFPSSRQMGKRARVQPWPGVSPFLLRGRRAAPKPGKWSVVQTRLAYGHALCCVTLSGRGVASSLRGFVAAGASEGAIPLRKLWLRERVFKENRKNSNISCGVAVRGGRRASPVAASWPAQGARCSPNWDYWARALALLIGAVWGRRFSVALVSGLWVLGTREQCRAGGLTDRRSFRSAASVHAPCSLRACELRGL